MSASPPNGVGASPTARALAAPPTRRHSVEASLLEQAPAAIVVTDPAGKIVYWNREAASVYGWSKADAVGRDLLSLVAAQVDEADPAYDVFEQLAAGKPWNGDLHLRHREGGFLRLRVRGRPLLSASSGQVGVMLVSVPADEAASGCPAPLRNDDELDAIGRRIGQARRQAGLTQEEVARRLGLTRRSLQAYEAGTVAPYRHLRSLGAILGRDRSWFLGGEAPPDPGGLAREELVEIVRAVVREEVLPAIADMRPPDDPSW